MKTWSVYSSADGLFTGTIISGPRSALEANLPPTMRAIEGRYDRICQRVDIEAGVVVDHRPSQPHEDYEWRAENPESVDRANQRWRWLKKPAVLAIEQRRTHALAQIEELERRQLRPLRELARDPQSRESRLRIDQLDIDIAKLREQLQGN